MSSIFITSLDPICTHPVVELSFVHGAIFSKSPYKSKGVNDLDILEVSRDYLPLYEIAQACQIISGIVSEGEGRLGATTKS
ncbi:MULTISPECIES: hypothetical protein [unclassified Pseudomonas]|uniref:hypothetical protein n=1 Tax=Pseudomonas TaxID=286 RepID=UPI00160378FD|nr:MULTISPECIES: hypothetical protein [unclassified Pseudomonas]